jgi:predicted alpha/beta-hydrolase family hydrolase
MSEFRIQTPHGEVGAILERDDASRALYVLAHGAGAGMRHRFMGAIAARLLARGVATLRYQFPYMEQGKSRTDAPPVATATVRAAVEEAARLAPGLALFAGGKSFGGRMTSTAASESPLTGVLGLAFLGFPLHPPGKPATTRAQHLSAVSVPMLFLQGTRDEFGELGLVREVTTALGRLATLVEIDEANHSFDDPKRTGRTAGDVLDLLADEIAGFTSRLRETKMSDDEDATGARHPRG